MARKRTNTLTAYATDEQRDMVAKLAKLRNRSVSQIIIDLIKQAHDEVFNEHR